MKTIIIAGLIAGAAVIGFAPTASADPHPPKLCAHHSEYTDAGGKRIKGNIYIAACAVGPGNGGGSYNGAAGGDHRYGHTGE